MKKDHNITPPSSLDREQGNDNISSFNSQLNGVDKKIITLNHDAFYGRVDHKDILQHLLADFHPVNFRELIELDAEEKMRQKHHVFGVVKHLLHTAKARSALLWHHVPSP